MPHGPIEHFTTDFADIIMWTDFHLFDLTFRGIALAVGASDGSLLR